MRIKTSVCKEKFENNHMKHKKYRKVRDHCHYTGRYRVTADSTCNLKNNVTKKNPIAFFNGSNYDCHLSISKKSWKKNLKKSLLV